MARMLLCIAFIKGIVLSLSYCTSPSTITERQKPMMETRSTKTTITKVEPKRIITWAATTTCCCCCCCCCYYFSSSSSSTQFSLGIVQALFLSQPTLAARLEQNVNFQAFCRGESSYVSITDAFHVPCGMLLSADLKMDAICLKKNGFGAPTGIANGGHDGGHGGGDGGSEGLTSSNNSNDIRRNVYQNLAVQSWRRSSASSSRKCFLWTSRSTNVNDEMDSEIDV